MGKNGMLVKSKLVFFIKNAPSLEGSKPRNLDPSPMQKNSKLF
jgi:hypothetical protein